MSVRYRVAALWGALLLVGSGAAIISTPAAYAAAGTTYWVDNASSACLDTGTGTQTAPFCTVTAAAKKAIVPGDSIQVAPGTYREQVTIGASGTTTDPITLQGTGSGVVILGTQNLSTATWTATASTAWSTPFAPPSAPKQVFVDGQRLTQAASATLTTNGSWFYDATAKVLYVDAGGADPSAGHTIEAGAQSFGVTTTSRSNVVVSGVTARGQNFAGFRALTSGAVTFDQVSATDSAANGILVDGGPGGAKVRGATVTGSLSTGIKLNATTGATVRDSSSHDNGLDGIGLSTTTGSTVSGNKAWNNVAVNPSLTAVGINVTTNSTGAVITGNTSHDNQDSGFQVYSGSHNALVTRNVAYSNGDHGFDSLNATGAKYLNNTSTRNRRDGISVEGTSTGARLANNILVDNGAATNEYNLYVDPGSVSGFSADRDLVYNHSTTPAVKVGGTVYRLLADYARSWTQETHGIGKAPAFVSAGNGNLHLQGGSPAVDAADSSESGFSATDADGAALADDTLVPDTGAGSPAYADLGALEFQPDPSAVDYAPHASMVVDPASVAVPPAAKVTADASGSGDADTHPITTYAFDFGDGSPTVTQADPVASHNYGATGTFTVRVTVTDDAGQSDVDTGTVVASTRQLETYRVEQGSASCTDTGSGTSTAPFCSIAPATKKAQAGDTVLVGAGMYREQITPPNTGEAGAPLTITATTPQATLLGSNDLSDAASWTATGTGAWSRPYAPSANPTQVWLDGSPLDKAASAAEVTSGDWFYDATAKQLYVSVGGANPASGHLVTAGARNFGVLLRDQDHVVMSGFTITQTNLNGVYVDSSDHLDLSGLDVSQAGAQGITVDGSTAVSLDTITSRDNLSIGVRFFNSTDSSLTHAVTHHNDLHGVSVQGSTRVVVTDATSYANLKPGTRLAAGIDVSASSHDCTVQDSTAYGNDDSGLESYTGSTGTTFRRNLSYDNGDHGIDNQHGSGTVAVSNTVVGNETAGINFEGDSGGFTTRNNISVDNGLTSTRTIGQIRVDETSETGADMNRDLVYHSQGGPLFEWHSQPYTSLADFRAASGNQEPDGLSGDPGFVNLAGRDLRLTGASPAIDAAYTSLAAWKHLDHDGKPPVDDPSTADTGNGPDAFAELGALEYRGPSAAATLTPATGNAPLSTRVDGSPTKALGAPITSYAWTCGNGSTVTGITGTCTYPVVGTYTVGLTVTDGAGLTDTWSGTVKVSAEAAPVAALVATPGQGYVPQNVVLDASGSTDNDGTPIATYSFNCGNGTTSGIRTAPTFTCAYPRTGSFTASVTVKDTAGLAGTRTAPVRILADLKPTANLDVSNTKPKVGQPITLNGSASTDPDNTPIKSYLFDCGNGTKFGPQTSPTATCTYTKAAKFTAKLTVTDTIGLNSSMSRTIQVGK